MSILLLGVCVCVCVWIIRYRETHGISMDEHRALLKQLDWEVEDFEAGFRKGVAHRDGSKKFLKHEALERQELAKGEVRKKIGRYGFSTVCDASIVSLRLLSAHLPPLVSPSSGLVLNVEAGVHGYMNNASRGRFCLPDIVPTTMT